MFQGAQPDRARWQRQAAAELAAADDDVLPLQPVMAAEKAIATAITSVTSFFISFYLQ